MAALRDLNGIALAHLENRDIQLAADDLQLLDGSGTVDVARDQQRALALLLAHEAGELGAVRGFTGALQADQHHDRGRLGGDGQLRHWRRP